MTRFGIFRVVPRGVAVLFCGAIAVRASAQIEFQAFRDQPNVGRNRKDTVVADVNGDGHADVAIARLGVDVHLGNGKGELGPALSAPSMPLGVGVYRIAVGDMNRDGALDLVVGCGNDGVAVYLADLAGGFAPARIFASAARASAIVVADLDGNGDPDVASAGAIPQLTMSTWLGDGAGGLLDRRDVPISTPVSDLEAGDFDEDGRMDVVGSGYQWIFLATGYGAGGFGAIHDVGSAATWSATGDFDEDGHLDIVASALGADRFDVYRGDGTGGFATATVPLEGAISVGDVADLNGDGHLDVVGNGWTPSQVHALHAIRGDGDGGFRVIQSTPSRPATSLGVADMDEDGRIDAVMGSTAYEHLGEIDDFCVIRGDGAGRFIVPPTAVIGLFPRSLHEIDVDGDGDLDLVTLSEEGSRSIVYVVHCEGGKLGPVSSQPMNSLAQSMTSGDWDRDGRVDLALASAGCCGGHPGRIDLHRLTETGEFVFFDRLGEGTAWSTITAGDLNGDGLRDFAAAADSTRIDVFIGDGFGGFSVGASVPVRGGSWVSGFRDIGADGNDDLIGLNSANRFSVWLGDGTGGLGPERAIALPGPLTAIEDASEDGHLDVFAYSFVESGTVILTGDGAGRFSRAAMIPGGFTGGVAVADFEEDGHIDLALSGIRVLRGDGSLGFMDVGECGGASTGGLKATDLDADGHVDLISYGRYSFENRGVLTLFRNSTFDRFDVLEGNVNARAGTVADVLTVNGSVGTGDDRRVVVPSGATFEIFVGAPPSAPAGPSPLVCYFWRGPTSRSSVSHLPFGLGRIAKPTPLTAHVPRQPLRVANSIGRPDLLGVENWPGGPTSPAPTVLLNQSGGAPVRGTFTLQGFIRDRRAPNGRTAVTNGITVVLE